MKQISILGSCVTRDIFSTMGKEEHLGDYRARTSLHTLFLPGLNQEELPDLSVIESNWQRTMVENDLLRTPLRLENSDYIIIDFIDDRFQKIMYKKKLVTKSRELANNILSPEDFIVPFKQGTTQDLEHWKESCIRFSEFIQNLDIQVILHKSRFAEKYLESNLYSDNSNLLFISKMNGILEKYERIFVEVMPHVKILEVESELVVSDPNHRWGLAPFHYIHQYYEQAWEQIVSITSN